MPPAVVTEHSLVAVGRVDKSVPLDRYGGNLGSRPLHEVLAPDALRAGRARALCALEGPVRRRGEDAVEVAGLEVAGRRHPGGGKGADGGELREHGTELVSAVDTFGDLPLGAEERHNGEPVVAVGGDNAGGPLEGESRLLQQAGDVLRPELN